MVTHSGIFTPSGVFTPSNVFLDNPTISSYASRFVVGESLVDGEGLVVQVRDASTHRSSWHEVDIVRRFLAMVRASLPIVSLTTLPARGTGRLG